MSPVTTANRVVAALAPPHRFHNSRLRGCGVANSPTLKPKDARRNANIFIGFDRLSSPAGIEATSRLWASSSSTGFSSSPAVIREDQVQLENGISMQVFSSRPSSLASAKLAQQTNEKQKPVLLFLHGSFHAAWCWTEKWFDYFVPRGYPVVASSWRGTGGTFAGPGVTKVKLLEHVHDLKHLLEKLPSIVGPDGTNDVGVVVKPVLICHSFAGLAVMKYLELYPDKMQNLSGIVTMCSVPPSGNGPMTKRFLQRSWKNSWKITAGFAMKRCIQNPTLCRELFFGGDKIMEGNTVVQDFGVSDNDIARYQSYFKRDTAAIIDIFDLLQQLPSKQTNQDGVALFLAERGAATPPRLVMGASDDFLVDTEGVKETAVYFGLDEPVFVNSPHDVMLGSRWESAASTLEAWLEENVVSN